MQKCQPQCQSGNSGNVGTTDWVEFWWKWAKRNPDRDSIQWELVSCVSTKGTRGICALGFVFENTPKWGEGFTVMAHLPPTLPPLSSILTARTLAASDTSFIFFSISDRQETLPYVLLLRLWGLRPRQSFTPTAFSIRSPVWVNLGLSEALYAKVYLIDKSLHISDGGKLKKS